jgi:hypothetical protein
MAVTAAKKDSCNFVTLELMFAFNQLRRNNMTSANDDDPFNSSTGNEIINNNHGVDDESRITWVSTILVSTRAEKAPTQVALQWHSLLLLSHPFLMPRSLPVALKK